MARNERLIASATSTVNTVVWLLIVAHVLCRLLDPYRCKGFFFYSTKFSFCFEIKTYIFTFCSHSFELVFYPTVARPAVCFQFHTSLTFNVPFRRFFKFNASEESSFAFAFFADYKFMPFEFNFFCTIVFQCPFTPFFDCGEEYPFFFFGTRSFTARCDRFERSAFTRDRYTRPNRG
jgi:hypothetical protein